MVSAGTDHETPDGSCVRDYIHVTDLVDAHIRALAALGANASADVRVGNSSRATGALPIVYNVGIGKGYSVWEFVAACKAVTGAAITVTKTRRRLGDPPIIYADSSKVKAELGWVPHYVDLQAALQTGWEWAKADRY